jgi:hypothetical protein
VLVIKYMLPTHLHLRGMLRELVLVLHGLLLEGLEDGEGDNLDSCADEVEETSGLQQSML